ncbi:hypothetical protein B0H10DRAFT_1948195 [Mycena sp. CBHHK59/15]|nr:hypothetical protein B0H10DRAFT_1948195 [Mycena sp. CBHHK59/15]
MSDDVVSTVSRGPALNPIKSKSKSAAVVTLKDWKLVVTPFTTSNGPYPWEPCQDDPAIHYVASETSKIWMGVTAVVDMNLKDPEQMFWTTKDRIYTTGSGNSQLQGRVNPSHPNRKDFRNRSYPNNQLIASPAESIASSFGHFWNDTPSPFAKQYSKEVGRNTVPPGKWMPPTIYNSQSYPQSVGSQANQNPGFNAWAGRGLNVPHPVINHQSYNPNLLPSSQQLPVPYGMNFNKPPGTSNYPTNFAGGGAGSVTNPSQWSQTSVPGPAFYPQTSSRQQTPCPPPAQSNLSTDDLGLPPASSAMSSSGGARNFVQFSPNLPHPKAQNIVPQWDPRVGVYVALDGSHAWCPRTNTWQTLLVEMGLGVRAQMPCGLGNPLPDN